MNLFATDARPIASTSQPSSADAVTGLQALALDAVEDRRQGVDRARVPAVQAHDRARLDRRQRALHDDVGTRVVVVERVDVEAEHGAVPRLGRDREHLLAGRRRPVVGARRTEVRRRRRR